MARDPAAEAHSGVVVLMEPAADQWHQPDRWSLVALIAGNVGVVFAMLGDLAWRNILDYLAIIGVAALVANAVGLAGCVWRLPRLMGIFATAAVVQFLLSVLVLQDVGLSSVPECLSQIRQWGNAPPTRTPSVRRRPPSTPPCRDQPW